MKIITLFNLLLLFSSCTGQESNGTNMNTNSPADTLKHFIIGNYMILPESKEIRLYTMIGGKNWDGFEYRKDPKINYETTTLLALGNSVFVTEFFPFNFNLDQLKIIHRDEFYFLCRDDKYIYYTSDRIKPTKIDISAYAVVNDFIYKSKSGKLFFVDIEAYKLSPVEIAIDEASVKHIAGNYYYDKNGLYFFGEHSKKNAAGYYDDYIKTSERLVTAQNVVPIIAGKYFSFNGEVFAVSNNDIKKLEIDLAKAIEIKVGQTETFITDGKTVYSDLNYGYEDDNRNEKGHFGELYPSLYAGINLQKIYSPLLHFMVEHNNVVFNKHDENNFPGLIAVTDNVNYLLANKTKSKIAKMLFYDPEKKTTEIFEEKYVKIFGEERFVSYKNVLYFDCIPVQTDQLDIANLREIKNSNYLTDEKSLFYIGDVTGYGSPTVNGIDYANFDDRILKNAYTKEMKAINPDVLSDGITLVSAAQKIKIKDLKLKVKIVD